MVQKWNLNKNNLTNVRGFGTLIQLKILSLDENKINSLSSASVKFLDSLQKPIQIFCVPSTSAADIYCDINTDLINSPYY